MPSFLHIDQRRPGDFVENIHCVSPAVSYIIEVEKFLVGERMRHRAVQLVIVEGVRIRMQFDERFKLGLFLVSVISNVVGYYFFRNIIWSIVWCDRGGKYNSLKKLKKDKSFWEVVNMKYLENYVDDYKSAFRFWFSAKKIYVIAECFLTGLFLILYFVSESVTSRVVMIIITLQSVIVSLILQFQIDSYHNTKYDRIRLQKRHKRKQK